MRCLYWLKPLATEGFRTLGGKMRKTRPVNALKKLGIGLAFGAATIMSMPTSALACTQVYMGKNLTADGNTYYGRSEDYGPRYLKHFGIEPSHGPGHTYSSDESSFMYTSTKTTYRYTYVRDHPSQWMNAGMPTLKQASTRRAYPAPPR